MKTKQFEFIYEKFSPWKEGLIFMSLSLLMLPCIGLGIWLTENNRVNGFVGVILTLTFALGGAALLMLFISNREKLHRRGKVKEGFDKPTEHKIVEADGAQKAVHIPHVRACRAPRNAENHERRRFCKAF